MVRTCVHLVRMFDCCALATDEYKILDGFSTVLHVV